MRFDVTERDAVPVLYTAIAGAPTDIPGLAHRAWQELEARLPASGREPYGYWDPGAQEYRACYSLQEGDDPEAEGLKRSEIPGGSYRRASLQGEGAFEKIGQTFDELARDAAIDEARPWFELYRGPDEVDLFVPIQQ